MNDADIERYIHLLNDLTVSYDDINEEKGKWLPRHLYRYRTFDCHWRKNLFKGIVRFNSPTSYNDPFDGWFDYSRVSEILNTELTEEIRDSIRVNNKGIREQLKNACFSEKNDNILMWSHYSDGHKGFCIEYETSRIPTIIGTFLLPVVYTKKKYDASHLYLCVTREKHLNEYRKYLTSAAIEEISSIPDDCFENTCLNPSLFKSADWEYEAEWRLCSNDAMNKKIFELGNDHSIDMLSCISAVYLGAEFDESKNKKNEDKIIEWAKTNNKKIYKMKKSDTEFSLELIPLVE